MPVPPKSVQQAAARGLEWRRKFGRGGTSVGVARARDLANGRNVSLQTLRRMVSYFARHEVDKNAAGFADDTNPSAGRIAWLLWGGDAGQQWAQAQLERAEAEMREAQSILLEVEGLPDKPKDAAGRAVRWVLLAQAPGFVYDGKRYQVDDDWIARQLADFGRLTRNGYLPPLLREHSRNGERSGDVLALESLELDGRSALIGAVAFSDPEAADKIKRGEIRYVSPAFGPLEDDTGSLYDFVLREVSLVAAPHQKHLSPGSSHVLGAERGQMDTEETVQAPELQEEDSALSTEERLANVEKSIAHVLDMLTKLMEGDHEEEDEETSVDVSATEAETAQLKERINALEIERDKAIWETAQPQSLRWTDKLAGLLFEVWRSDKDAVSAALSEATIATPAAPVEEAAPVNPFAVQMSEPASAQPQSLDTDADLSAEALRIADGDQHKALAIYQKLKMQTLN